MRLPKACADGRGGAARRAAERGAAPCRPRSRSTLIERLADAGLRTIEAGSFVSPRWVPQMADTAAVMAGIARRAGVSYPVLVPNMKGYEAARAARADEIAIFAAASESFSRRNINCSIAESIERFAPVAAAARRDGVKLRGYVSCAIDCPYEGAVAPAAAAEVAARLMALGCYEVSLGDTIGTGTAGRVEAMLDGRGRARAGGSARRPFPRHLWPGGRQHPGGARAGRRRHRQRGRGARRLPLCARRGGQCRERGCALSARRARDRERRRSRALAAAGRFISAALGREPASKAARALAAKAA